MQSLVARRRQQETTGGKSIPSRPPGFLDVRLEGRRHAEVDHEADRGMIDTHAEGIRRAHHPVNSPRELILEARSRG